MKSINNIKNISEWEVLSPNGWSSFSAIKKISKDCYIKIIFCDDSYVECSESHRIKSVDGDFVYAKNVGIGDIVVGKDGSDKTVKFKRKINKKTALYDLLDVEHDSEYFTNNIVSHNCAFIPNSEEAWVGANATTSTGGKAIILSTPNGAGDFFHKMWMEAESKQNGFNPICLPWHLHPERDQNWRDVKGAEQGDKRKAAQEFDCSFSTSGNTVLDPDILKVYRENVMEPIERRWAESSLWIWKYPDYANGNYLVAADVARGDGSDKSAFHIIDLITCEQVAEFKGIVDTKSYGNLLVGIANEYNKAILVVENNNIGWATLQQVLDLGYPNTFYSSADLMYVDVERQMVGKINRMEKNMIPGFALTPKNRPLLISKMELYFRENSIKINSIRTIEELSVFIWNGVGKAEAMKGYNDDLVMSLSMGLWLRDTAIRLKGETSEFNKALINGITRPAVDTNVYLTRDDVAKRAWSMPIFGNQRSTSPLTMRKDDENLTWLLK